MARDNFSSLWFYSIKCNTVNCRPRTIPRARASTQHYLFSTTSLFAGEITPVKSGRWMLSQHCKGLFASWALLGILPEWGDTVRLWAVRADPLKPGELFSHGATSAVLVQPWRLTLPIVPQKGVTTHRENRTAEFLLIFFRNETVHQNTLVSVSFLCLPRAVGQQAGTQLRGHCGDGNRFRVGCWRDLPSFWNLLLQLGCPFLDSSCPV